MAAILLTSVAACLAMPAQETTATLYGSVVDPNEAVVSGTRVTATNELTGFDRQTTTDENGHYTLPLLPVGKYELSAEADGFRRYVQKGITLTVNQAARIDIELAIGAVSETIEVVSEAGLVNTLNGAVGQVVNQRNIAELPLNGRNFLQLATLQAGIAPGTFVISEFTPGHPGQVPFSANGLRQQSNNFLLDGADNNDGFLGTAASVPSPDALQEFRILTNSYSAEYGRGGGAVVNIVTRSGTNDFHGSIFEFLRNEVFDARNFFFTGVPALKQNQFGGTLGGPIRRSRTFFFGSYEGFRLRQGITASAVVPSVLERRGDFSRSTTKPLDPTTRQPFPNDIIPPERINPIAGNIMALYPAPNRGTNQLNSTRNGSTNTDQLLTRVDHAVSRQNTFSARYFFENGRSLKPFTTPPPINVPGFPFGDKFRFQNLVLSDTHTFSPQLLNEARIAYSRTRTVFNQPEFTVDPRTLGFTFPVVGQPNMPLLTLSGLTTIGTSFETNGLRRDNIFQFQDHLTYIRGKHNLKTGVDVFRNQFSLREDNSNAGSFTFSGAFSRNPIADLLLGLPASFSQANAGEPAYFFSTYVQPYIQDDVRLSRRLTLNLGLRYEVNLPVNEKFDRLVGFRPGRQSQRVPNAPAGLLFVGDPGLEHLIETDLNNLAPRVGFAWDVHGDGKMSVRGGYGIYYDVLLGTLYGNFVVSAPFTTTVRVNAPEDFSDPFNGHSPFAGGAIGLSFPSFLQLNVIDGGYRSPYDQQWNLSIQRELTRGLVMEVGYLGTKGTHLPGTRVLNTAQFVPGNSTPRNIDQRRPYAPAFGQILNYQSTFDSNYHALQLTVNKQLSRGLSFLAAYTWSKTIDDGSFPTGRRAIRAGTIAQNQDDLRAERGLSIFDIRHRFVISYLWEIPVFRSQRGVVGRVLGGWQLNGITTFQSGRPFIVQDSSDPNLDGVASDHPDVIRNPNLPADQQKVDRFFDTSAFVRVPPGTNRFGTAGRNIVIGPGYNNFDVSLIKNIHFGERAGAAFRWEVFNLFNHANFDNPGGGAPANDIASPVFGKLQSTVPNSERIMQFALKLGF
jgi:hypothetical protein